MTEGKKFDGDKLPLVQGCYNYFPRALMEVARSSKFGHVKYEVPYEDQNWSRVENGFYRYTDGVGRHMAMEQIEGEYDSDAEPYGLKILHAGAGAWNSLARLELLLREKEKGT